MKTKRRIPSSIDELNKASDAIFLKKMASFVLAFPPQVCRENAGFLF